jgi:hypothetical protein
MKTLFFAFVITTMLAFHADAALQSESFYDAQVDATLVNPGANTIFGQYYVGHIYYDDRVIVTPFQLPYLAPGQTITSASVSWNYAGTKNTPTTSVDVYGLTRIATTATVTTADFYIGPNDTANTLLQPALITPTTTPGTVTCSNAALVTWLQAQYAAFAAGGTSDTATRYVFLRLNGNGYEPSQNTNYLISTPDNFRPLIPTLTITVSGNANTEAGKLAFQFYTPTATITSAAVYQNGGMVRSLWNNAPASAGVVTAAWDGNDDFGNPLPASATYTIKVATNGVSYNWDGAIGNTSTAQTGYNVHRSLNPIEAMDISGTNAFFAVGYNEQQTPFHSFPVGSPQAPVPVYTAVQDPFSAFSLVAADNNISYWAKTVGGVSSAFTYVIGISEATNKPVTFSGGSAIPTDPGTQKYTSGIDLDTSTSGSNTQPNPATGLAVQKSGTYLFVCHSNLNVIRVFNKTSGALANTIPDTTPGLCATDTAGNLYVLSGTTLQKFTIASDGSGTLAWTVTGLIAPVGVGCDPTTTTVTIADSGVIEAFDTNTSLPVWSYGAPQTLPTITNATFLFGAQDFIAYQPDGTFWVGDQGNNRYLHFSVSSGTVTYVEQIAYYDTFYTVGVDPNAINHVFADFLEYCVNYSKAPGGLNGSWTLLNNWAAGLPSDSTHNYVPTVKGGIGNPVTLSNGRRYALLLNFATNYLDLYELPPGSVARFTGESFPTTNNQNYRIYADGSLRFATIGQSGGAPTITYNSEPLSGFDGSNNPQWGSSSVLCSYPLGAQTPIPDQGTFGVRMDETAGGYFPVYGPGWSSTQRYHLGILAAGGSSWLTQTMLNAAGNTAYTGRMPRGGLFDSGNSVQYPGNVFTVSGANVFLGYHGELWKNGEASTFFHYLEDGLMLGSFGMPKLFEQGDANLAISGYAGNNFSQQCVTDPNSGIAYIYTNDESQHGGPNRWSVNNLGSVAELATTGTLGSIIALNNLPPATPTGLVATQTSAGVSLTWPSANGAFSYNVKRGSVTGGPYTTINTVFTGSYTDQNVSTGNSYYYVVTAVNAVGETPSSNEAAITILTPFQQFLTADNLSPTTSGSSTPDNDGVSVLLKYATGLPLGVTSVAGPATVSASGDHLVITFNRVTPAPVNYFVETSTDLVNWSSLASLAASGTGWTGTGSVAETGTGPVAVAVTDTASLSGGTGPRFLRLRVTGTDGTTEPGSLPAGDLPVTLAGAATTMFSLPLDNVPVGRATVQAVATSTLTVVNAGNWAATGSPYALRLLSGNGAGRTWQITAQNGNALGLATAGVDLTQFVAVGDRYEVLPVDTVTGLFGTTNGLLAPGVGPTLADNLLVWNGTTWLTYYFNGTNWKQSGSLLLQNNLVMPVGGGLSVTRRVASAEKFEVIGRVPEVGLNQFTTPGAYTFLSAAYPLPVTLSASGFASASGWLAGPGPTVSDNLLVWNGTTWLTFYYTGSQWRQSGSLLSQTSFTLAAGTPVFVYRHSTPSLLNSFIAAPLTYTP